MGSGYERTTVSTDIDDLPADMRRSLDTHARTHQLALDDALPAWLTRSVNPPSTTLLGRLFHRRANPTDPDSEHQTAVIVHPRYLLVVISGAERGVSVLAAPLATASVSPGVALTGASAEEPGFTVSGFPGAGGPGSFYVGLGPEPAARQCYESVRAAVAAAKQP